MNIASAFIPGTGASCMRPRSEPQVHGRGARATVALLCVALCAVLFSTSGARAGIASKAVTETAEYVVDKFGAKVVAKEVGEEGTEVLANRIGTLAAKYGEKESV